MHAGLKLVLMGLLGHGGRDVMNSSDGKFNSLSLGFHSLSMLKGATWDVLLLLLWIIKQDLPEEPSMCPETDLKPTYTDLLEHLKMYETRVH